MIKLNKLTQAIATVALLVGASSAFAETLTVPASVTVNNAIDFSVAGELNFGEIRAMPSTVATECAVIELPANPASPVASVAEGDSTLCASEGTAVIQSVGGTPSRPEFTVAGVAAFTDLDLSIAETAIILVGNLPSGSADFTVGNFSAYKTSGTPADITLGAADNLRAGSDGTVTFTIGAELATDVGGNAGAYEDGIPYVNSFNVTVAY